MSRRVPHPSWPRARPLAELIGPALHPILRKRGLARTELFAWWPEIVGADFAQSAAPERISWPRGGEGGVLYVRCDPAVALQLTNERDRIRERLNRFLGFAAIAQVRIRQEPLAAARAPAAPAEQPVADPQALAALERQLAGMEGPLKDSLAALGRQILARS